MRHIPRTAPGKGRSIARAHRRRAHPFRSWPPRSRRTALEHWPDLRQPTRRLHDGAGGARTPHGVRQAFKRPPASTPLPKVPAAERPPGAIRPSATKYARWQPTHGIEKYRAVSSKGTGSPGGSSGDRLAATTHTSLFARSRQMPTGISLKCCGGSQRTLRCFHLRVRTPTTAPGAELRGNGLREPHRRYRMCRASGPWWSHRRAVRAGSP